MCNPVYVEGAEPGDTLAVEIIKLHSGTWGWTVITDAFGLLAGADTRRGGRTIAVHGAQSSMGLRVEMCRGCVKMAPAGRRPLRSSAEPTFF